MRPLKKKIIGWLLVGMLFASSSAWCDASAPLPPNGFQMQASPVGIPQEISALAKKWSGEIRSVKPRRSGSSETQKVMVAVEKILSPTKAEVYVSWGDVQGPYAMAKAGWARVPADISVEAGEVRMKFTAKGKWHFTCVLKGGLLFCHMRHEERTTQRWGDLSPM